MGVNILARLLGIDQGEIEPKPEKRARKTRVTEKWNDTAIEPVEEARGEDEPE